MGSKFIKNIAYMVSGKFFLLFLALISVPIYVRFIGLSDYAIIGIVFSFFSIIYTFDLQFFLTLVKSWHEPNIKKKFDFEQLFSTTYLFILVTNVMISIPLLLLIIFLTYKVYHNPSLIPFYAIGLLIFMVNRVNNYLEDFLRGRSKERLIQKSMVTCATIEFLLTMTFLLVFNLGVMSILVGAFIQGILYYLFLNFFTRKSINYSFYFSPAIIVEAFKKYTLQEYFYNITNKSALKSGLFLSTFFLSREAIGILTVFFSLEKKIRNFTYSILFRHLTPIFSSLLVEKQFFKIRRIIQNTTFFVLLLSTLFIILLTTVGKPFYLIYYGEQFQGTYFLLLLLIFGVLIRISTTPSITYLFVSNPSLLNKINVYSLLLFLVTLIILIKSYAIFGVIIAYLIYFYFHSLLIFVFITKSFKNLFSNRKTQIIILLLSQLIAGLIYSRDFFVEPLFMLIYFLSAFSLVAIINFKKIFEESKFMLSI